MCLGYLADLETYLSWHLLRQIVAVSCLGSAAARSGCLVHPARVTARKIEVSIILFILRNILFCRSKLYTKIHKKPTEQWVK